MHFVACSLALSVPPLFSALWNFWIIRWRRVRLSDGVPFPTWNIPASVQAVASLSAFSYHWCSDSVFVRNHCALNLFPFFWCFWRWKWRCRQAERSTFSFGIFDVITLVMALSLCSVFWKKTLWECRGSLNNVGAFLLHYNWLLFIGLLCGSFFVSLFCSFAPFW